jgi:hypothetical protein
VKVSVVASSSGSLFAAAKRQLLFMSVDMEEEGGWSALKILTPPRSMGRNSGGGGSGAEIPDAPPPHRCLTVPEVEIRLRRDGMHRFLRDGSTVPVSHRSRSLVGKLCCRWRCSRSRGFGTATDVEHDFDDKRIVYYLYGREFLWDDDVSVADRVSRIVSFLDGKAKQRALNVLTCQPDRARYPDLSWRSAMATALRYGALEDSFTVFEDRTVPLVLKLQASDTCFLSASTTTLGYNAGSQVARAGNAGSDVVIGTTLDAAQYVRHRMSNDMLEQLVVKNQGGSSLGVLMDVVGSANIVCVPFNKASLPGKPPLERSSRNLITYLRYYGAGLVSNFDVSSLVTLWTDYQNSGGVQRGEEATHLVTLDRVVEEGETLNILTTRDLGETTQDESKYINSVAHANQPQSDAKRSPEPLTVVKGSRAGQVARRAMQNTKDENTESPMYHAMVLVGYRCEIVTAGNGSDAKKYWFLLQNSWEPLPLLEVSASFFARFHDPVRQGMTHFVADFLEPADVSMLHGVKFECNADDSGDGPRAVPLEDRKEKS